MPLMHAQNAMRQPWTSWWRPSGLCSHTRKTLYVKSFWDQFESKRKNQKKTEVEQCRKLGRNQWTTPLTQVSPLRLARPARACVVCFGHAKFQAQKLQGFWLVWQGCNAIKSL